MANQEGTDDAARRRGAQAAGVSRVRIAAVTILVAGLAAACSSLGSGPGASQWPTPPPGFPVGSWTTSITREDLRAGGLEGDLVDQNEGDFVLTFEPDGTFQEVQTSTIGVALREPIFRGHYAVTGAQVRLNPEFPAHYAQEGVYDVVDWQLEDDVLRLALASHGDTIQVVVYGAHPWRRVTTSGIVGTWQMTVTKADVQGIGVSDPGMLNENSGRFTRSFLADGTWTSAQESLDGSPVFNPVWRGTYTVEGDEVGVQIDYPTQYQGDLERYRWAVDGNDLRLTLLEPTDDPIARLLTEAHPWTRTTP